MNKQKTKRNKNIGWSSKLCHCSLCFINQWKGPLPIGTSPLATLQQLEVSACIFRFPFLTGWRMIHCGGCHISEVMEDRERKRRKVSIVETDQDEDRTDMADIAKIPEVLTYVLSFVQPRFPHLLRLSLVCKLWYNLIAQPSALWGGSLSFNGGGNYPLHLLPRPPRPTITSHRLQQHYECCHTKIPESLSKESVDLLLPRLHCMLALIVHGLIFQLA